MSEVNLTELRKIVDGSANPYKVVRRDAIEYIGRLDRLMKATAKMSIG